MPPGQLSSLPSPTLGGQVGGTGRGVPIWWGFSCVGFLLPPGGPFQPQDTGDTDRAYHLPAGPAHGHDQGLRVSGSQGLGQAESRVPQGAFTGVLLSCGFDKPLSTGCVVWPLAVGSPSMGSALWTQGSGWGAGSALPAACCSCRTWACSCASSRACAWCARPSAAARRPAPSTSPGRPSWWPR